MQGQNAVLDFQSAPVPGRPMEMEIHPAGAGIDDPHLKEKESGFGREEEVDVMPGLQLLEGDEPTEEEYLTLRK